ncbi:MAG TPA: HEAT repeat domain-containing protein, partial [Candidatus Ozemobacteraceae bacterium]|nr:HEAT repeat domain-containing protein [Candidatus Ozemobacteraceae bacterium]
MNRLAIFERSIAQPNLEKATDLITGGQTVRSIGGCSPQAAHQLLAWTDIPIKTLQEGTDPEGGEFLVVERPPHGRRDIVRSLVDILADLNSPDLTLALEFMNQENSLLEEEAALLIPFLQKQLFSSDQQVRYLARKARDHLLQKYPDLEKRRDGDTASYEPLEGAGTREILLQKMRLGSRFVCFDAIERLTDSGDTTLIEPLMQFLEQESDPFKIAHLVKRIPRLKDQRIAKVLRAYLSHPDPRIVANAVEGFWYIKAPDLVDEFAHLGDSPDNRIRANAIKALFP